MISKEGEYVGWTLLVDELDEAKDHLQDLIERMSNDPAYDEGHFRIDLGHVIGHLNLAWYRRKFGEDLPDGTFDRATEYHEDLDPL